MVPTLKDVLDILEEIAPSCLAEEWDNPGLQVGRLSQEIRKVFVALDPTLRAVRMASERHAQLLLTHHALIFGPISSLNEEAYPGNVVLEAFKKEISIVAAHTNLDAARGGINDILAELLGLQDVQVLDREGDSGIGGTGLGRIGDLPERVGLPAMVETLKGVLGAGRLRVCSPRDVRVKRVAVVGGSGGGMVPVASRKGADLLITGDVRHHEALQAQASGLTLIDAGHFYTERAALGPFALRLQHVFAERGLHIAVALYDQETGPMRYE